MRNCIRIELKKAFFNKIMIGTSIIVIFLVIWQGITTYRIYLNDIMEYKNGNIFGNPMITAASLFVHWIGADVTSFQSSAFFFLLPLFVTLPYGWSLIGEIRSGYLKNMFVRISRRTYFFSKYIAVFISAALLIMIPLFFNFFVLALFLPALKIDNIYPYGILGERGMWSGIYYQNPFLYTIMYIVMDGIFAGLIACISVTISFFVKHKVTVLAVPFFLMMVIDYLDKIISVKSGIEMSPIKFLHSLPMANDRSGIGIFILGSILFFFTLGISWFKGESYEVL